MALHPRAGETVAVTKDLPVAAEMPASLPPDTAQAVAKASLTTCTRSGLSNGVASPADVVTTGAGRVTIGAGRVAFGGNPTVHGRHVFSTTKHTARNTESKGSQEIAHQSQTATNGQAHADSSELAQPMRMHTYPLHTCPCT